jgi:hypothetical protein
MSAITAQLQTENALLKQQIEGAAAEKALFKGAAG